MKTVEETRRELFEAWGAENLPTSLSMRGSIYASLCTQKSWQAFNAALDAVVIELPKPCAYESLDSSRVFVQLTYEIGSDAADPVELVRFEDCREAINSTNLGLKIK